MKKPEHSERRPRQRTDRNTNYRKRDVNPRVHVQKDDDSTGKRPRHRTDRNTDYRKRDVNPHVHVQKDDDSTGKRPRQRIDKNTNYRRRAINPQVPLQKDDDTIRLNKFIAASGVCSRREADEFIKAGLISVNGNIVMELGTKVTSKDDIRYNGERIKSERLVYVLLNKPKDFITTVKDPHATKTVLQLVAGACKERIYPVGRLDRNTTGVLLLTNDGDLTKTLTHPRYNKLKIYHVTLDKNLTSKDLSQVRDGVTLEDGFIKADDVSYIDPKDKSQIGIEIHSGKNRIVRRIFEQMGYRINKLDRVYFAGLTKKGLTRGQWRHLSEMEVSMLKMGSYK